MIFSKIKFFFKINFLCHFFRFSPIHFFLKVVLEASEKTVTAHYYTAKEAATIAEMEKVFGYMGAKGLQGTEDEEPIPQA